MTRQTGLKTVAGVEIPLRGVEIDGEIVAGHARVRVRQRYVNAETKPVEAVYTFPLPADATLSGFRMACAGRRLEGVVREREQAFREYDDAITAGHGAALLDQERPNVFTASVGNLLPGEDTLIEVEYLQRLHADEGAVRWMVPTVVAPRYIPGEPAGDRTAHGCADPTGRVPDADRISPPIGDVSYGLRLSLIVDLGEAATVSSPSHAVRVEPADGAKVRVGFRDEEVALDRDLVLVIEGAGDAGSLAGTTAHRSGGGQGTVALTLVPDLFEHRAVGGQAVVFVIDTSGSMSGESLPQAKAALHLCLRHLREGDRFDILAFDDDVRPFKGAPVPYTQKSLEEADRWVARLHTGGGTEMLDPLERAVRAAPDGIVVLLTDGQVGNEDEIARKVLGVRGRCRFYAFGIGTAVSDALLRQLARTTGGAVEFIHPGERIDDKVIAQFARALAPRVDEVSVRFEGVTVAEWGPEEPRALVDGEPWTLFGRYDQAGEGRAVLRGRIAGREWSREVPVSLPDRADSPTLPRLWAAERIRSWEDAALTGRRAEALKERIVRLAVEHGIATAHTSFVVVEERDGDRRAHGQPQTRVVPVNAPAGWAMFKRTGQGSAYPLAAGGPMPRSAPCRFDVDGSPPAAAAAPGIVFHDTSPEAGAGIRASRASAARSGLRWIADALGFGGGSRAEDDEQDPRLITGAPAPFPVAESMEAPAEAESGTAAEDAALRTLFKSQLASGLWDDPSLGADEDLRRLRETGRVLATLLAHKVSTSHPLFGAPVRKAVAAVGALAARLADRDPGAASRALAAAWLLTDGARTRRLIEAEVRKHAALADLGGRLGDEARVREVVRTADPAAE